MADTSIQLENHFWTVTIWPQLGANMGQILHKASRNELIRWPDDLSALSREPYLFGMPLLFPAGCIAGGVCRVGDEIWEWPRNDPSGPNHLHGFLWNRPFVVKDHSAIHCVLEPAQETQDLLNRQMHEPIRVIVEYRLSGPKVEMHARFTNQGTRPVPFGFGYHVDISLKTPWQVFLPSGVPWVMGKDLMPNHPAGPGDEVPWLRDLPFHVRDLVCDVCYSTRLGANHENMVRLALGDSPTSFRLRAYPPFRHWVLYRPHRNADFVSIEPYTWVHNAPNLTEDPSLTGMRLLGAEESIDTQLSWECDET